MPPVDVSRVRRAPADPLEGRRTTSREAAETGKKKRSTAVRFPAPGPRAEEVGPDRSLSDLIKEMGSRLLRKPETPPVVPGARGVAFLASAAWNAALGVLGLRDRCRELLGRAGGGGSQPWAELVSTDLDGLLAGLVENERAQYPADRRRIVSAEVSAEREDSNVRVIWADRDTVVTAPFRSGASNPAVAVARSRHPSVEKLVAKMKRKTRAAVVDLASVVAGRAAAESLQRTIATSDDLAGLHPAHAACVCVKNQVSVMSEQLTALKEMAPLEDLLSEAEARHWPNGPRMSPLTRSYFTCWAFFDACMGAARATIGTTVLEVGAAFGMHPEMLRLAQLASRSTRTT